MTGWEEYLSCIKNCAHRSMDRTLACEAGNLGSTPNERTKLETLACCAKGASASGGEAYRKFRFDS